MDCKGLAGQKGNLLEALAGAQVTYDAVLGHAGGNGDEKRWSDVNHVVEGRRQPLMRIGCRE